MKVRQKNFQNIHRTESLKAVNPRSTIAQYNKVSIRTIGSNYNLFKPVRIVIPDFFNVPSFEDGLLSMSKKQSGSSLVDEKPAKTLGIGSLLKKRMKDLSILAEGMKRSKNIKQQSRYYFIQGVLFHNSGLFQKAIEMFDKFLKIVLFIKDQKSVQLALNAIGGSLMYLGDFEKALDYHSKQASIIELSDKFISKVNCGLCYQLKGEHEDAYRLYMAAHNSQQNGKRNHRKLKFLKELIERVQSSMMGGEVFMTQKQHLKQNSSLAKSRSISQQKSIQLYKQQMEHSPSRESYERAKIGYAVCSAEEKLEDYIQSMRQSYSYEVESKQQSSKLY